MACIDHQRYLRLRLHLRLHLRLRLHLHTLALLAIIFVSILPRVSTQCNGTKTIQVEAQYKWTKDRDAAFPNKDPNDPPGFTQLLCASTKQNYTIWRDGDLLASSVRDYLKNGGRTEALNVLISEELTPRLNRSIWDISSDDSNDFFLGDERTNLTLELNGDRSFTYVSCIAKISPSADWFIGVYDINMCNVTGPGEMRWMDDGYRVVLFGYDGGTFDTQQYDEDITNEKREDPFLSVRRIRTVAPRGYGEMNITSSQNGMVIPSPTSYDDEPSCFPANEMVLLPSGERIPMEKLSTGSQVLLNAQRSSQIVTSSKVFAFTHRDSATISRFIQLTFSGEQATLGHLRLTAGHYIYRGRMSLLSSDPSIELVAACELRIGDLLFDASNQPLRVISINHTYARGLYAPHSMHGDLIVNGVRVSCYTTAVPPAIGSIALAPLRLLHNVRLQNVADFISHYIVSDRRIARIVQKLFATLEQSLSVY